MLRIETFVIGNEEPRGSLTALLDTELRLAEQDLLRDGTVVPRLVAVKADGEAHLLAMADVFGRDDPAELDAAKTAFCQLFRQLAQEEGFVRYAIIVEAWSAKIQDPAHWQQEAQTRPPSKREDRVEIVSLVAGEPGRTVGRQREILRGPDGKPTGLGPSPYGLDEDLEVGGRFAGLLDD